MPRPIPQWKRELNPHDRWRELAKDPKHWIEAVREYRALFPTADLVEASRKVKAFYESTKSPRR